MAASLSVLIVDDHPPMRMLTRRVLERAGVGCVREAGDGPEALALFAAAAPDLALIDHGLPGMSGLALLETLRAQGAAARLLMLTGRADAAFALEAREAGADGVLTKPIAPSALLAAIEQAMAPRAA